jgi:hypothetical protein
MTEQMQCTKQHVRYRAQPSHPMGPPFTMFANRRARRPHTTRIPNITQKTTHVEVKLIHIGPVAPPPPKTARAQPSYLRGPPFPTNAT